MFSARFAPKSAIVYVQKSQYLLPFCATYAILYTAPVGIFSIGRAGESPAAKKDSLPKEQ